MNTEQFYWINQPQEFALDKGALKIQTEPETDFWQKTHYGFSKANAPAFLTKIEGDFTFGVKTAFDTQNRYDQCGILLYIDDENWIKVAVEHENEQYARLGSLVTNLGYSDWATVDIDAEKKTMWYRVQSKGVDVFIEYSETGKRWEQMRIAHLHQFHGMLAVGVYACSPSEGEGCEVLFDHVTVEFSFWID